MNDVVLESQIIQQKLDRKIVVRLDATDFRRSENYSRRLFLREKIAHRPVIGQIKLGSVALRQVIETFALETAHYSTADKTAVTGDKNFLRLVHHQVVSWHRSIFFFPPLCNPHFRLP
jgi:hypothetical protein